MMDRFPKIMQQYDKLILTVNQAERKETDPNRSEYLHWLRTQLEAINIDDGHYDE